MFQRIKDEHLDTYDVELSEKRKQCKETINASLKYHVKKALSYRRWFLFLAINSMILNATIPLINQLIFDQRDIVITVISITTTIFTGICGIMLYKDSWRRYRNHSEQIKTECNRFNACVEPYDIENIEDREKLLINNFEALNGNERVVWLEKMGKKSDIPNKTYNK